MAGHTPCPDEPDLRLVPYAILVPGPVAAVLSALFPAWLPLIITIAAITIVALTLRLLANRR